MSVAFLIGDSAQQIAIPNRPGLRYRSALPQQSGQHRLAVLDRYTVRLVDGITRSWLKHQATQRIVTINTHRALLSTLSDEALSEQYGALRRKVMRVGHCENSVIEGLAHASLCAQRLLGLTARPVQLSAADALLHGCFVEMATGEGKTLATVLAASVAALDGTPIHVLTTNDYLAERDACAFSPIYDALGMSAGCVLPDMADDTRRSVYKSNIVHVTGKQIGFDWMRDELLAGARQNRLATRLGLLTADRSNALPPASQPLLPGLCMAIVDEADSLLVDEARTPLVLAQLRALSTEAEQQGVIALALASMLSKNNDYIVLTDRRHVELTERGKATVSELASGSASHWPSQRYRDERVRQALIIQSFWWRDRDYIVRDGAIELVDENTGRSLPDRRLQNGLHTLLELKERCELTAESDVVASISCQRLFQRYRRLVGTSGTLKEVSGELRRVYDCAVIQMPRERKSRLTVYKTQVLASSDLQLAALMRELKLCMRTGRPVLIGTRSVEQSEWVSNYLKIQQISHRVISADQSEEEAMIISQAGHLKQITVATNMAGRGTDIVIGDAAAQLGGLHVISLAFHDAQRIDRQLAGRAARQGAPGSFHQLWSLDDPVLIQNMSPKYFRFARQLLKSNRSLRLRHTLVAQLIRSTQRSIERRHARQRSLALKAQEYISYRTAISGNPGQGS